MRRAMVGVMVAMLGLVAIAGGADWPRFRGPGGAGISDDKSVPVTWSDTENLRWKLALPGPGSSSPIVYGDRVYVTCYSGYGVSKTSPGKLADLKRHLVCVNRSDGKIVWSQAVKAELPEDMFRGFITEHGYASSTPVTDGERVYVFFGKSGAAAFDLAGKKLWQVSAGKMSSNRRWGSAASPVLYKDWVIVNASEEGRAILALDKKTGKQVWKAEGGTLELSYNTPLLVDVKAGRQDLVVALPNEVWGMNPDTGKLRWFAKTEIGGNVSPTVVAGDGGLYIFGGYPRLGSAGIRAGGSGDVTKTHVMWTSKDSTYVPSPVYLDGKLYWVSDRGVAFCIEAKTSKRIYSETLAGLSTQGRGKLVYASTLLVGGRLYAVTRTGGTYVLAAKPAYEQIAVNRFASDTSDFHGTPAVSDGQMFLRSNRYLYCVQAGGK